MVLQRTVSGTRERCTAQLTLKISSFLTAMPLSTACCSAAALYVRPISTCVAAMLFRVCVVSPRIHAT